MSSLISKIFNKCKIKKKNIFDYEMIIPDIAKYAETKDNSFQYKNTMPDHLKIYKEMKNAVGLENTEIDFHLGAMFPSVALYKEENGVVVKCIELHMTNDSQEHCYRASLRHELEHIITGNKLIDKIGLEKFIMLQKGSDEKASLAFKTIAEYLSWKVACEEDEQECCSISLYSLWQEGVSEVRFCDTLAAYTAYETVHNIYNNEIDRFPEEKRALLAEIRELIKKEAHKWPMTMDEYREVGEKMMLLLSNMNKKLC